MSIVALAGDWHGNLPWARARIADLAARGSGGPRRAFARHRLVARGDVTDDDVTVRTSAAPRRGARGDVSGERRRYP